MPSATNIATAMAMRMSRTIQAKISMNDITLSVLCLPAYRPMLLLLLRRFKAPLHLFDDLVDAEARWPLTWRILLERCQEVANDRLGREDDERAVGHEPVPVGIRRDIRALVRIRPQVKKFRQPQLGKRLGPDLHGAPLALLLEHDFPVLVTHVDDIAIVVEVDELLARAEILPT